MSSLERTKACGFCKDESYSLNDLQSIMDEGRIDEVIRPLDELFSYSKCFCNKDANVFVENGNVIPYKYVTFEDETLEKTLIYRVYHSDGRFAGLYKPTKEGLKLDKFFLE